MASASQLCLYAKATPTPGVLTTSTGAPIDDKTNSRTAGPKGPVLLEDFALIDELAHFDRERIPERVVHAKGAGAFGYFEVTHDISKYTKAKFLSQIGKRTKVALRFSTVGGESGSADTARDPRGFAVKFYTEEGVWDMVGNNTPVFFIRDPIFFPSFIHTQKRNPVSHLKDPDAMWDFISLRPETTHQVTILFSDRGIPLSYRFMNGYSSHTLKLVNSGGKAYWCKWHFKTDAGVRNLSQADADRIAGTDPDHATRDLFEHIASGNEATWSVFVQVMEYEDAYKYRFNPFDVTKVWPHADYPLIPVGKLILNRNPDNYFAEIEQIAFSPSHMVPGIEPSPDKMLQARLFSYPDTHRHRLGPNYHQIPVNASGSPVRNYQRDGLMTVNGNQTGAPNYFPNSFNGPKDNRKYASHGYAVAGDAGRHESAGQDDFTQAGALYRVMTADERTRLVENIAGNLSAAQPFIQERAIANFTRADGEYGKRIGELVAKIRTQKKDAAVPFLSAGKPAVRPKL